MNTFKVKRESRQNKSKVLTVRLTPDETEEFNRLKDSLEFDSGRDLVIFSVEVLGKLQEWENLGYKFYIGKAKEKDYRQVEFELVPGSLSPQLEGGEEIV